MNSRQAIALALGTVAALTLVLIPRTATRVNTVSHRTLPTGEIDSTYRPQQSLWQPITFAIVVVLTGAVIYSLRRKI